MAEKTPLWTRETTAKVGDGVDYLPQGIPVVDDGVTYRLFTQAGFAVNDVTYVVCAMDASWEYFRATVVSLSPFTLRRTQVLESTNANAPVVWPSGSKDLFVVGAAQVPSLTAANTWLADQVIESSAAGTDEGPRLVLRRRNPSPSGSDHGGVLEFVGRNSAGADVEYGQFRLRVLNAGAGSERSELQFYVLAGGASVLAFRVKGDAVELLTPLRTLGQQLLLDANSTSGWRAANADLIAKTGNADRLRLDGSALALLNGLGLDLNGGTVFLDVDADLRLRASTDDLLEVVHGSTVLFRLDARAASPLNGLDLVAAAAGANPRIAVQGADADRSLEIVPKGTGTVLAKGVDLIRGASPAWVRFAPDTTVLAGVNVAAVTDIGTGQWRVTWDRDFASANYIAVASICRDTGGGSNEIVVRAQTAGEVEVVTLNSSGSNTENGLVALHVAAFGTLV